MRSAALTLAASALAASTLAAPAMAQAPQDEVAQLRALLRQQAAAMQVMQQRLNAIEARQRSAAARAAPQVASQAGTVAVPDPGEPRSASGGADQGRRSIIREPAPGGGGAGIVPASPEGRPGPEAQPTPAGTVESSPRQQAATTGQAPAPAAGNPPLAVLSGNDRVQVTLSGQVNRDILFYNDGSGRTDTYFADNNVSSTRLRALGSARLDKDTIAISTIEFDLRSNSSA